MPAPWRAFERLCDALVDTYFAEPVEMHPWSPGGISDEGGPDPARAVIVTYGILVMPGAHAIGESGTVSSGLSTRVVANDVWLSIQEDRIAQAKLPTWKEGDRIYFPDRDEWYSVLYPTPSVTARPQIELARMQKVGSE